MDTAFNDIWNLKYNSRLELQASLKVSKDTITRNFYKINDNLQKWCDENKIETYQFQSRLPKKIKNTRVKKELLVRFFEYYKLGLIASYDAAIKHFSQSVVSLEDLNNILRKKKYAKLITEIEYNYKFNMDTIYSNIVKDTEFEKY